MLVSRTIRNLLQKAMSLQCRLKGHHLCTLLCKVYVLSGSVSSRLWNPRRCRVIVNTQVNGLRLVSFSNEELDRSLGWVTTLPPALFRLDEDLTLSAGDVPAEAYLVSRCLRLSDRHRHRSLVLFKDTSDDHVIW